MKAPVTHGVRDHKNTCFLYCDGKCAGVHSLRLCSTTHELITQSPTVNSLITQNETSISHEHTPSKRRPSFTATPHSTISQPMAEPSHLSGAPKTSSKPTPSNTQACSSLSSLHFHIRRRGFGDAIIRSNRVRLGLLHHPSCDLLFLTISFLITCDGSRGWRGEGPSSSPQSTERDQRRRKPQNRAGYLERVSPKRMIGQHAQNISRRCTERGRTIRQDRSEWVHRSKHGGECSGKRSVARCGTSQAFPRELAIAALWPYDPRTSVNEGQDRDWACDNCNPPSV